MTISGYQDGESGNLTLSYGTVTFASAPSKEEFSKMSEYFLGKADPDAFAQAMIFNSEVHDTNCMLCAFDQWDQYWTYFDSNNSTDRCVYNDTYTWNPVKKCFRDWYPTFRAPEGCYGHKQTPCAHGGRMAFRFKSRNRNGYGILLPFSAGEVRFTIAFSPGKRYYI